MMPLPPEWGPFYELEKDEDGEPFYSMNHAGCENCVQWASQCSMDKDLDVEHPIEWCCVGLIPYLTEPKNQHEELNRVRICLYGSPVRSYEFTPWEAHRLGFFLVDVGNVFLVQGQPGTMWEELQKILTRDGKKDE